LYCRNLHRRTLNNGSYNDIERVVVGQSGGEYSDSDWGSWRGQHSFLQTVQQFAGIRRNTTSQSVRLINYNLQFTSTLHRMNDVRTWFLSDGSRCHLVWR